jgi:NTP pyrophosphatase (non-canonical NTP hydrolase)
MNRYCSICSKNATPPEGQYHQCIICPERFNAAIGIELNKAIKKFPDWPHSLADGHLILAEEFGEVSKALCDFHFGRGTAKEVLDEMAQTGAMLHRLAYHILNTDKHIEIKAPKIQATLSQGNKYEYQVDFREAQYTNIQEVLSTRSADGWRLRDTVITSHDYVNLIFERKLNG